MHILQISAPKSGSMWLYHILQQILQQAQLPRHSLIQEHPIHAIAQRWDLSHAEQANIDMVDIEPLACYYRISSIFRMPITDFAGYVQQCNHVWTHSPLCPRSFDLFRHFDKIVYIVRDPRDRLISASKFAFTKYMQKYYPHNEQSPESFLVNQLHQHMVEWRWHVGDHLRYRERLDIHFLFYERLLAEFATELEALLCYLEIELTAEKRQQIEAAVTFDQLRGRNPQHVRRGTWGQWQGRLSEAQNEAVLKEIGPLLQTFSYTKNREDNLALPATPTLPQHAVETVLGL